MIVNELFEILKNTKFMIKTKRYKGRERRDTNEEMTFSLSSFGRSSYGGYYEDTFIFKIFKNIDSNICIDEKKFNDIGSIDDSLLQMKIRNIDKINLLGYINEANSGNGYYNNNSSMTIEVY